MKIFENNQKIINQKISSNKIMLKLSSVKEKDKRFELLLESLKFLIFVFKNNY